MLTALVAAPLVAAATVWGGAGAFAGLTALAVLAGAWEWAGLAGFGRARHRALFLLCMACLLGVCHRLAIPWLPLAAAALALVWWGLALGLIIRWQRGAASRHGPWARGLAGLLTLGPAWVCLTALHREPSVFGAPGPWAALALLLMVWSADTGAWFAGRRWGRRKLAHRVSPGKTWEGLWGGMAAGLAAGAACSLWLPPLTPGRFALFMAACVAVLGAAVVGDLGESLAKRQAGLKDSGRLFPGHGGALDRIDSLTAAAPMFFLCALLLEKIG